MGAYYGDEKEVRALTVTTYHSAFPLLERWGAQFPLLVLDEVHHLADSGVWFTARPRAADVVKAAESWARPPQA